MRNRMIRIANDDYSSILVTDLSLDKDTKLQIRDVDGKNSEKKENGESDETAGMTFSADQGRMDNEIRQNGDESKDTGQDDCAWYHSLRERFSKPQSLKMHRGAVCAVILSEENASECLTMFSVGRDGFIKVYSVTDGIQLRSTKLGSLPLSSLALANSMDAYPVRFVLPL